MIITAKNTKFPPTFEASQVAMEALTAETRAAAAEYNKAQESGRSVATAAARLAELEDRRRRLSLHLSILVTQVTFDREAAEAARARPKHQPPPLLPLPKKHRALLAAEKDIDAAIAKCDACHEALRAFAASDHGNDHRAHKKSLNLQTAHRLAVHDHVAASLKVTNEREIFHKACADAMEQEFRSREVHVHEYLDAIEDMLHPLRQRSFFMMKRLRDLRKAIK